MKTDSVGRAARRRRPIDRPTLISFLVCGALVLVGAVRVLSYHRGLAELWVDRPLLRLLSYRPDSLFSVCYFKFLASLSVAGLLYFLFRWLNRGHRSVLPPGHSPQARNLDFRSPWVRLALLSVVHAHWALLEWYKFSTHGYPYSPLEDWRWNALVLTSSGLAAFWLMKHLSFRPLVQGEDSEAASPGPSRSACL
jgi:hypothetical protein